MDMHKHLYICAFSSRCVGSTSPCSSVVCVYHNRQSTVAWSQAINEFQRCNSHESIHRQGDKTPVAEVNLTSTRQNLGAPPVLSKQRCLCLVVKNLMYPQCLFRSTERSKFWSPLFHLNVKRKVRKYFITSTDAECGGSSLRLFIY